MKQYVIFLLLTLVELSSLCFAIEPRELVKQRAEQLNKFKTDQLAQLGLDQDTRTIEINLPVHMFSFSIGALFLGLTCNEIYSALKLSRNHNIDRNHLHMAARVISTILPASASAAAGIYYAFAKPYRVYKFIRQYRNCVKEYLAYAASNNISRDEALSFLL